MSEDDEIALQLENHIKQEPDVEKPIEVVKVIEEPKVFVKGKNPMRNLIKDVQQQPVAQTPTLNSQPQSQPQPQPQPQRKGNNPMLKKL